MAALRRATVTVSAALLLAACASTGEAPDWRASYRRCTVPGYAHLRGIPIDSGQEHAAAEHFAPRDPAHCVLYVVRRIGVMTGPKSAHAKLFLYRAESAPALPGPLDTLWVPDWLTGPIWMGRLWQDTGLELHRAEIFGPEVYAMWELAPGHYVLDASLAPAQPFARATVICGAGQASYWAVASRGMTVKASLQALGASEGQALVRDRLRSAGMQAGGPSSAGWTAWRSCAATAP